MGFERKSTQGFTKKETPMCLLKLKEWMLQLPERRKAMGISGGGGGSVQDMLGLRYLLNSPLGTSDGWRAIYIFELIKGGGTLRDTDSGSAIHRWHFT